MGDTPELDAAIDALNDALPELVAAANALGLAIDAATGAIDRWLADHAG